MGIAEFFRIAVGRPSEQAVGCPCEPGGALPLVVSPHSNAPTGRRAPVGRGLLLCGAALVVAGCGGDAPPGDAAVGREAAPTAARFERIATFPVVLNLCDGAASFEACAEVKTIAEIVAATDAGTTLIYTDAETGSLGFVDITTPDAPVPSGTLAVGGTPTSVAIAGPYALAVVDTSPTRTAPSGELVVIDTSGRRIVTTIDLGGQPDSIAVAPGGRFAAVAIENERDRELDGGVMPQLPAGFLVIVDLLGSPDRWTTRRVDLTGIAGRFPEDPEPEFVDINDADIAAVTLQENNHVVLVELASGAVIGDFTAGTVRLEAAASAGREGAATEPAEVPREPDAIHWLSADLLATADEGDFVGGSRGFTLFDRSGEVRYTSGRTVEEIVRQAGFEADDAGQGRGTEPEGLEFARFGDESYLFVGPERSRAIVVCRVRDGEDPEVLQVLPAGPGPEGILAIAERGLLVVASEQDDPAAGIRSALTIYRYRAAAPTTR